MEYYSAFKRKEILQSAKIWTHLEDIMLGKNQDSYKDKYCMSLLIWGTDKSQAHKDRMQNGSYQGLGKEEKGELMFNGSRASVLQAEKVTGIGNDNGCSIIWTA